MASPPELMADPPVATVPAAGGVSTHQLANPSDFRVAFKIKSSNNANYRLKPVFGFVDPGGSTVILITRLPGPVKEDHLVVNYKKAPTNTIDATSVFKDSAGQCKLVIPLKCA